MAITRVGEVGVHIEGEDRPVLLRPSLRAMASLGEAEDIVELFSRVMSDTPQIEDCAAVWLACCAEGDEERVSGLVGFPHSIYPPIHIRLHWRAMHWMPGSAVAEDIAHIARSLLKHGIIGVVEKKNKRPRDVHVDSAYKETFEAHEWASIAVAHLGMTEEGAWSMTMTGLLNALNTKFPPKPEAGENAPSREEYEATMEWFDQVSAAREAASKGVV